MRDDQRHDQRHQAELEGDRQARAPAARATGVFCQSERPKSPCSRMPPIQREILLPHRLVEAERADRADRGDSLSARDVVLAQHHVDDVARDQAHRDEDDEAGEEQRRDQRQQARALCKRALGPLAGRLYSQDSQQTLKTARTQQLSDNRTEAGRKRINSDVHAQDGHPKPRPDSAASYATTIIVPSARWHGWLLLAKPNAVRSSAHRRKLSLEGSAQVDRRVAAKSRSS